jgi:hypothetical protein
MASYFNFFERCFSQTETLFQLKGVKQPDFRKLTDFGFLINRQNYGQSVQGIRICLTLSQKCGFSFATECQFSHLWRIIVFINEYLSSDFERFMHHVYPRLPRVFHVILDGIIGRETVLEEVEACFESAAFVP